MRQRRTPPPPRMQTARAGRGVWAAGCDGGAIGVAAPPSSPSQAASRRLTSVLATNSSAASDAANASNLSNTSDPSNTSATSNGTICTNYSTIIVTISIGNTTLQVIPKPGPEPAPAPKPQPQPPNLQTPPTQLDHTTPAHRLTLLRIYSLPWRRCSWREFRRFAPLRSSRSPTSSSSPRRLLHRPIGHPTSRHAGRRHSSRHPPRSRHLRRHRHKIPRLQGSRPVAV